MGEKKRGSLSHLESVGLFHRLKKFKKELRLDDYGHSWLYLHPESRNAKGKMLERLKRHAWKACNRQKRFGGSNPPLSAELIGRQRFMFPF